MTEARFWRAFVAWHIRTDHPWDHALHLEAMSLSILSITITLRDALSPAIERAAATLREFGYRLQEIEMDARATDGG